jgi:putative endonuclease
MDAKPASPERIGRYRRGRFSELVAAATLLAKGYRILARRCRTPHGEIDLIAVRGRRLAFVEVKRRAIRQDCEAALTPRQAGRISRAAEFWISRNARYRDHDRGLDAVLVSPAACPCTCPMRCMWKPGACAAGVDAAMQYRLACSCVSRLNRRARNTKAPKKCF